MGITIDKITSVYQSDVAMYKQLFTSMLNYRQKNVNTQNLTIDQNKLLNDYPTSEYAQIIKNPNYAAEKNTQKGEVETYYTETYNIYSEQNRARNCI